MERTALASWQSGYEANKNNLWGKRCKEMIEKWEAGEEPTPLHVNPAPRRTWTAVHALASIPE